MARGHPCYRHSNRRAALTRGTGFKPALPIHSPDGERRKLAVESKARHETVVAFLEALGISSPAARADAEGMEHHVSRETLLAFEKFLATKVRRSTPTGLADNLRQDD